MKRLVTILSLAALVFSGCRKEADYHPYIGETGDLAYDSFHAIAHRVRIITFCERVPSETI